MIMLYKKLDDIVMHVFIIIFLLGWVRLEGREEVIEAIL